MALHQALIKTNGVHLNIAQAGIGHTLVFLHGLGWDHLLWTAAFSRYAGRFHVIAGDTRGHGGSDAPPGPYSIRQFADDWRGALDALGIGQACLVGLSQGAMIAMQLAVDEPKRFTGLFLAAAGCRVDPLAPGIPQHLAARNPSCPRGAARETAQSIFSPSFRAANPAYMDEFIARRAAAPTAPLLAAKQADAGFDLCTQLEAYDGPCTVVAGSADVLTQPDAVLEVAACIPGARFERVDGAGQMIPVERPDRYFALLDAFLDHPVFAPPATRT